MSSPANRIRPEAAGTSPETVLSRVVFPAPLEPTMQVISPDSTARLISHSTRTSPYPALSPSIVRSGSATGRLRREAASEFLAEICLDDPLVLHDIGGASFRDELPMVKDQHALGERHHDFHQMLDDEDGHAALGNLPDQRECAIDLAGVEAGIDLVQHQNLGAHGHALGQLETLAAGQRQRRSGP